MIDLLLFSWRTIYFALIQIYLNFQMQYYA